MPDNEQPVDVELEAAVSVLVCMGGQASNQARRFLGNCTDEEITALAACENGKRFRQIMDQVADRQNPPPQAEAQAPDLAVPPDPAPLEEAAAAETDPE